MLAAVVETFGRYQLLKKLATGGMAQIYLARQVGPEGFEKLLVVKRILPHLAANEEFVTMFLDEARIAARLNHRNVVQIFDLGAQDATYFLAMEYIHGEDLRRLWKHAERAEKPLSLALICRIIIETCAGLEHAHKMRDATGRPLNIVHRDISPQNILVSFEGGVKVVDFGIAKAADQATVTRAGILKGKYAYMSPEQVGGQPIDARSDIFALGVVLYELLTGTRLFRRATDNQTLDAVAECRFPAPSEVNEQLPPSLDAIVMKALAKDRSERYSEAREFGAELERWLFENAILSSSATLADYMHDLYAERLEHEKQEGRVLFETGESAKPELPVEKATPALQKKGQATQLLTKRVKRASRWVSRVALLMGGFGVAALIGALSVWAVSGVFKKARLKLASEPSGVEVKHHGATVCTTPCVLANLDPGLYEVSLEKPGFRTATIGVELESGVTQDVGRIELESVVPIASARVPPQLQDTQPLLPAVAFQDKEERRVVKPVAARGTLRFVVKPWAVVSCPQLKFKDTTPFQDQHFPAGEYTCTFSHPDYPMQTKLVRVEPNETLKVQVSF